MRRFALPILILIVLLAVVAVVLSMRQPGLTTGATLLPDGPYVVYFLYPLHRNRGGDLYALQTETGARVQLTQGNQTRWAALAPDGRKLALVALADDDFTLSVLDLDTGALTEISGGVSSIWESSSWGLDDVRLAWASDSAHLAWEGTIEGESGIFVSVLDGSTPVFVADGSQPAWSPDGRQILYIAAYETEGSDTDLDISVAEVENGQTQRLLPRPGEQSSPQWSPDGAHLLFIETTYSPSGWTLQDLYVADSDGDAVYHVTQLTLSGPVRWSPDGTSILFHRSQVNLCQAFADGSEPVCAFYVGKHPVWSSTGTQIVYGLEEHLLIIASPIEPRSFLVGQDFDGTGERIGFVFPLGWRP